MGVRAKPTTIKACNPDRKTTTPAPDSPQRTISTSRRPGRRRAESRRLALTVDAITRGRNAVAVTVFPSRPCQARERERCGQQNAKTKKKKKKKKKKITRPCHQGVPIPCQR